MATDKQVLILQTGIYNSIQEGKIYNFLTGIEYTGQFNKRFETYLNAEAIKKFGSEIYKNWGMNGEDKEYPKVRFSFRKSDYQFQDTPTFELTFYYSGQRINWDSDNSVYKIDNRGNEHETMLSVKNLEDIKTRSETIFVTRLNNIKQMKSNIKNIDKLKLQKAKLLKAIEDYNSQINYIISEEMRIHR